MSLNVAAGTPTASGQFVNVAFNTAMSVILMATDPDSPPLPLSYTVIAGPTHGTLSGTAPDLMYTPEAGYDGSDSFTFASYNGTNTSTTAIVSPGSPPARPRRALSSVKVAFNTATSVTLAAATDPDIRSYR